MSSVIRPGSGKPAIRRGYGPDEGDSGVQRIRTGVVNVTPGDDFEFIAPPDLRIGGGGGVTSDGTYVPFFGAFGAAWDDGMSPIEAPTRSQCCGRSA